MRAALLILFSITATGCAGPLALRTTRQKYNEAVQRTTNEQLLLNLDIGAGELGPVFHGPLVDSNFLI